MEATPAPFGRAREPAAWGSAPAGGRVQWRGGARAGEGGAGSPAASPAASPEPAGRYSWSFFSSSEGEEEGAGAGAGGLGAGSPSPPAPAAAPGLGSPPPGGGAGGLWARQSGHLDRADLSLSMSARKGERPRSLREITNAPSPGAGGGAGEVGCARSSAEWQGRVQSALRKSARLGQSLELNARRREPDTRASFPGECPRGGDAGTVGDGWARAVEEAAPSPPREPPFWPRGVDPAASGRLRGTRASRGSSGKLWKEALEGYQRLCPRSEGSWEFSGPDGNALEPQELGSIRPCPPPGAEGALRRELEETRGQMRRLAGRLEEQSQARVELAEGYQRLCARYEAAMRDQDGAIELQAERNKSLEEQQREALEAVRRLEEQLKDRHETGGAAALRRAEAANLALREELQEARAAGALRDQEHAELMTAQQEEAADALTRQAAEVLSLRQERDALRAAVEVAGQRVLSEDGAAAERLLSAYEPLCAGLLARLGSVEAERERLERTLVLCWERARPYLPAGVLPAAC